MVSPLIETDCLVPAGAGGGVVVTRWTWKKLDSVMGVVLYRRSYWVALPVEPSSPGAVQLRVMLAVVAARILGAKSGKTSSATRNAAAGAMERRKVPSMACRARESRTTALTSRRGRDAR